jgi:NAD(P)-dependent dehydrogenase (short-subunit alcohol dehydrogenase family)
MTDASDQQTRAPWWRSDDSGRRLAGKRAFVTGAGTAPDGGLLGVGEAIAVLFAAQGAQVAVCDIAEDRAQATLRMVEAVGGRGITTVGDLTDVDENRRCVDAAAEAFDGLDLVVNSAALPGGGGSPAKVDLDAWDAVMALNLRAAFLVGRHAVPHLVASGGGSIINISSVAASLGHGSGAYAASKAGLEGLTRDWAYLHGRDNIRANSIEIGHIYTPMGSLGGDAVRETRRLAGMLGTEGDAWDVAWPAVFLASDESGWITGVMLPVDAGTTATGSFAISMLNARRPG